MLHYLKPYYGTAVLTICFMISEVLIDLYQPRMMASIVNEGILGLGRGGLPDPELVLQTGLLMVLVVLVGGFCGVMGAVCVNRCAQNFGNDIRKDCFRRIMHFSLEQVDFFHTGSLITRITSDTTQVQAMVSSALRSVVRSTTFLIAGTAALLTLDLNFGIIAMLVTPVVLFEVSLVVWKSNPLFLLLQQKLDALNGIMQEDISGARVIKGYHQEKRESRRFGRANDDLAATQLQVLLLIAWLMPLVNIVLNLALVGVIYVGSFDVQAGLIGPGTIMAALTYIVQILNGLLIFAMILQLFARGLTSKRRLQEILQTRPVLEDGRYPHGIPQKTDTCLDFHHVSFRYPSQMENVLTDISLTVKRGETLAIVGATGSGKSTLIKLLPRFYDASAGQVLVDGVDVRDYPLKDLRQKMAVVLQKTELFSLSIRDNIAWGEDDVSFDEVKEAAHIAQADGFIARQPDGYDTEVAEGGMSLSGGQRQRLALARAIVRQPEILILDDSTSALDLRTEAAFYEALGAYTEKLRAEGRSLTKIIVAQRIATARRADRIAVLESGRLAALGTHAELLKDSAVYREICASQLGVGERGDEL
ncbi:MAG: ABC transporter ATP-binding protein [Mitsuokella sp.]|uniref:ABC transporter ATP-binding protein n=1 Tax=Mitsuokella sp. TaxID=2049034 RepID=UPI003EFCB97E